MVNMDRTNKVLDELYTVFPSWKDSVQVHMWHDKYPGFLLRDEASLFINPTLLDDDAQLAYILIHLFTLLKESQFGHTAAFWKALEKNIATARRNGIQVRKWTGSYK